MQHTILALITLLSLSLSAATIAIVDSGVDVEHKDLQDKLWINSVDSTDNNRDEDRNGFQDDIFGWNFAENNNLVIDRKYIGTFSDDPYTFFAIQGRSFLGQATEADKKWLQEKRQDKDFAKEMGIFGNFIHGTHVAGIAAQNNEQAKILSVKLLPTEVKPFVEQAREEVNYSALSLGFRMKLLKGMIDQVTSAQAQQLADIFEYVGDHGADIANGSFGTGFPQAMMITKTMFKILFFREPTKEEHFEVTKFFMDQSVKKGKAIAKAAPNTLLVFAAGNDGSNNDEFPASPTNIDADNVISVAATYQNQFIAPFSNYGRKTVDIAAPGMLVNSQIPGDEYLAISGTSQAAPYISNIAASVKDANPELKPVEIKKILMATADKKSFLSGKVKSGLVNPDRAFLAGKMSKQMSIDKAIDYAKQKISRQPRFENKSFFNIFDAESVKPIQMPSLFR